MYISPAVPTPNALITGAVLRWARERRGLTHADLKASVKASVEEIRSWEQGSTFPPYAKAQSLARTLRIPFGFLFLSTHPPDDVGLPDLRTRAGRKPEKASPDLIELVNDVLRRQEWYREFAEENGASKLAFVASHTRGDGAEVVAANIRKILGINETLRRSCNSWAGYITQLTRNAEAAGILVMRSGVVKHDTSRRLLVDEFQGFAISDPLAPVIFINSCDTRAAQVFTFAHEAAHIWIGENGISNPDDLSAGVISAPGGEQFCHDVAAETLVPKEELASLWHRDSAATQVAEQMARRFWVSTIVVLRRAYESRLLERQQFFALVEEATRRQKPQRKSSGGSPYLSIPARTSVRFVDSVLGALRERRLLHTDASALLALSQPMLLKLASRRLGK